MIGSNLEWQEADITRSWDHPSLPKVKVYYSNGLWFSAPVLLRSFDVRHRQVSRKAIDLTTLLQPIEIGTESSGLQGSERCG